jgi:hypothetical protein
MMLRFNDGININTDGELRTLRLRDGWYVVGKGMLVPVADEKEANELLDKLKGK